MCDDPGAWDAPGEELWAEVGGGPPLQPHAQPQRDAVVLCLQHSQLMAAHKYQYVGFSSSLFTINYGTMEDRRCTYKYIYRSMCITIMGASKAINLLM